MTRLFEALEPDQLDCIDFIDDGEDSLIAADVGTGKTVISMTAAARDPDTRWLVLAPLLVANNTWATENKEWDHLSGIDVALATGSEKQRIDAIESGAQFTVMNYDVLPWLMEHYQKKPKKPDSLPFNGLIADEIDKLKSVSSNRFKLFRNRIGVFNRRIGLTGTLLPNDLTELWGQVYMVDGGQTFGRSFYEWRKQYFYPTDFNQYNWVPFERSRELLAKELDGLVYRLEARGLPEVVYAEPEYVDFPEAERKQYDKLEKDFFTLIHDNEGQEKLIDGKTAAVTTGKLQQMTSGFLYADKGGENAVWHSTAKFKWLQHLLYDTLRDQQVLVVYHFKAELEQLFRHIPGIFSLKGTNKEVQHKIKEWNAGHIHHLAVHPASAGHGLNLQKSHACHIACLTMPWSGGMLKQVFGRLARRGNQSKEVVVHTCLFEDTVDEDVFAAGQGKLDDMSQFLALID